MTSSHVLLHVFVLTKIQESIECENWSELRLMFGYLDCQFPIDAKELYDKMPEDIRIKLFSYHKARWQH